MPRFMELEAAHHAVGGQGRGRRYVTEQINRSCIMMVAAQWQGYCRDLHSEAADVLAAAAHPATLQVPIRMALTSARRLDIGNADADDIGSDFGRLGMAFWDEVERLDKRNAQRKMRLRQLYAWRNSIVHEDGIHGKKVSLVAGTKPTLRWARIWLAACGELATQFDRAVAAYLTQLTGAAPWKRHSSSNVRA